ncbi:MAG TPA: cytochrome c maturation protein CcmE [Candidatus Binataceae bacterium]|nr:cytochrome c maturation protein CcmE [Candidatus Binataceae bacterium]
MFRPRFLVGACLIAAAVGFLIFTATRNTAEYYLTVPEVSARATELMGQPLRVAGRVTPADIHWDPATLTLRFGIAKIPDAPDDGAVKPVSVTADPPVFRVTCAGQPKPDMFAPGREVIVEGRLKANGEIEASQVLTSCPSKYKAKPGQ